MTPDGSLIVEDATIVADGCTPDRAERVSRMIFDHLQGLLARQGARPGTARVLPHLRVPSLEVDWEMADDDTIARQGAAWIYRWLTTTT